MTARRRAGRVAVSLALLPLLLPLRTATGAIGVPAAPPTPDDLVAVGYAVRLPDSGHIRFIRASSDGRLLFVGTTAGAVERSADGGRTWQDMQVGVPGGLG